MIGRALDSLERLKTLSHQQLPLLDCSRHAARRAGVVHAALADPGHRPTPRGRCGPRSPPPVPLLDYGPQGGLHDGSAPVALALLSASPAPQPPAHSDSISRAPPPARSRTCARTPLLPLTGPHCGGPMRLRVAPRAPRCSTRAPATRRSQAAVYSAQCTVPRPVQRAVSVSRQSAGWGAPSSAACSLWCARTGAGVCPARGQPRPVFFAQQAQAALKSRHCHPPRGVTLPLPGGEPQKCQK